MGRTGRSHTSGRLEVHLDALFFLLMAKETGFNLVILTEVAEGHGSAMSIGSFDSSKCKGTPVLDSGPRHDSIAQHRVTDCGIPIAGFRFWGKRES